MPKLGSVTLAALATVASAPLIALAALQGPVVFSAEKPSESSTHVPEVSVASCDYLEWVSGSSYVADDIVKYGNGKFYRALRSNPGYDPTVSTWHWAPYTCDSPGGGAFGVSEAQFNEIFPDRDKFYTYQGLVAALSSYPKFGNTGNGNARKQEVAAFLANVQHETGGLAYVVEQNTANYAHYCDASRAYGCPAGQSSYYGRGPLQLSWNFNYKAAGDALGTDLLNNPALVRNDSTVAWKSALWFWNTQTGAGTMTAHDAIVNGKGFGETVRTINGALECGGLNPDQVRSRIDAYRKIIGFLGATPGDNQSC